MERRAVLKRVFILSTGTLLLPSFLTSCAENPQFKLKRLSLSRHQELLLEALSDTIIPQTDTPGAKELGVHVFVVKMVDDCFDKEKIINFQKGIQAFDAMSVKGESFLELTLKEKTQFLKEQETSTLYGFLETVRYLTIEGYTHSEYVMTNLVPYKLAPGPFKGVVKIQA